MSNRRANFTAKLVNNCWSVNTIHLLPKINYYLLQYQHMGACFAKDGQKQHINESLSKMSEQTIFEPEDPYATIISTLAKPPELPQRLEIQNTEQDTIRADSTLKVQHRQTPTPKIGSFLKNDSELDFNGGKMSQQQIQIVQCQGRTSFKKNRGINNIENVEQASFSFLSNNKRLVRNNTSQLQAHNQRKIVPPQLTFSSG